MTSLRAACGSGEKERKRALNTVGTRSTWGCHHHTTVSSHLPCCSRTCRHRGETQTPSRGASATVQRASSTTGRRRAGSSNCSGGDTAKAATHRTRSLGPRFANPPGPCANPFPLKSRPCPPRLSPDGPRTRPLFLPPSTKSPLKTTNPFRKVVRTQGEGDLGREVPFLSFFLPHPRSPSIAAPGKHTRPTRSSRPLQLSTATFHSSGQRSFQRCLARHCQPHRRPQQNSCARLDKVSSVVFWVE
jgi:hypothetical protein